MKRTTRKIHLLLYCFFYLRELRRVRSLQRDAIVAAGRFRLHFLHGQAGVFGRLLDRVGIGQREILENLIGLYTHHEMRAAFEIEARDEYLLPGGFDSGPGEIVEGRTMAWANNYVNTGQRNNGTIMIVR